MKWHCLLVDDEPPAIKLLQSHIAQVGGFEVVGTCRNAVEAMDILHGKPVDVMFLDIKMPKIIGTRFLKSLWHPPKVIFVTAYRDYAVEGFELDAVDYLLKPVSFERFLKAVDRLNRTISPQPLAEEKVYRPNPDAFVYVKADRAMQKVFVNEILYVESCKDYVRFYFTTGKFLFIKQPISAIENLLSHHHFMRVHRSYIVSVNKISGYSGMALKMNSTEIPIGRLYKQSVMQQLSA